MRVQPARRLKGGAADQQIVGAGYDFVVTIGANDLERQILFVAHGVQVLICVRTKREQILIRNVKRLWDTGAGGWLWGQWRSDNASGS